MSRFKSNRRTMLVEPKWLVEVIWLTAAMRPNCRSSGVATADAIVCGSAPGKPAPTLITGKSTLGREATGRKLNARIPESSNAAASNDVPIGRRINGAEILMLQTATLVRGCVSGSRLLRNRVADLVFLKPVRQPVKPQINHRSCVEREQLAQNQSADDGYAERPPQLRSSPWQQSERQTA